MRLYHTKRSILKWMNILTDKIYIKYESLNSTFKDSYFICNNSIIWSVNKFSLFCKRWLHQKLMVKNVKYKCNYKVRQ